MGHTKDGTADMKLQQQAVSARTLIPDKILEKSGYHGDSGKIVGPLLV